MTAAEDEEGPVGARPDPQEEEAAASTSGMDPDHPLLQRAQQSLKAQLLSKRLRIEGELRERQTQLQRTKKQREDLGVELYGYQQTLAKLQLSLERTQGRYAAAQEERLQAEEEAERLRGVWANEEGRTKQEQSKVDAAQKDLERLAATLREVGAYNAEQKGQIQVTRRATAAAEEAMQKLERRKLRQDFLIADLQDTLASLTQRSQLHAIQLEAQRRETRAARERVAAAEEDMEGVHLEKRRLVAQWRSSLAAVQRRDEALAALREALLGQQQAQRSVEAEIGGCKRDVAKEQARSQQLESLVRKLEAEGALVARTITALGESQRGLEDTVGQLAGSCQDTERKLQAALADAKACSIEALSLERALAAATTECRATEAASLSALGEAAAASKSGARAARDVAKLREAARAAELKVAEAQNTAARLEVETLNASAHIDRLTSAMALLEGEQKEKDALIARYEAELKRRMGEVERKARELDALNRKLERQVAAQPDAAETGPLEATIAHLRSDIDTRGAAALQLQRTWMARQAELVGLQTANTHLTEALARLRSEQTVLRTKRARLEASASTAAGDARALASASARLRGQLSRLNARVAESADARAALQEAHTSLRGQAAGELAAMEAEAQRLGAAVQAAQQERAELMAELAEAERRCALVQRKLQLEREMQEVLNPTEGEGLVQAMQAEVRRMTLRHDDLMRTQQRLVQELERALCKHEVVGVRALASATRAKSGGGGGGGGTLRMSSSSGDGGGDAAPWRGPGEGRRALRRAEREVAAANARIEVLEAQAGEAAEQLQRGEGEAAALAARQEALRAAAAEAAAARRRALLATARAQRCARRWDALAAGTYRAQVPNPSLLSTELARTAGRGAAALAALEALRRVRPELGAELERVAWQWQASPQAVGE